MIKTARKTKRETAIPSLGIFRWKLLSKKIISRGMQEDSSAEGVVKLPFI